MNNPKSEILVVSTGETIKTISNKFSQFNGEILSWGDSFPFLLNHNCEPNYWSFVDPHSSINSLEKIVKDKKKLNTKLYLLEPLVNTSYNHLTKSMGRPGFHKEYNWRGNGFKKLNNIIEKSKNFIEVESIHTKTYMQKFGKNNKNYKSRFKELVEGEELYALHVYGITAEKLTTCVLPLVYHLGYTKVFLAGFDGRGKRYNKKKAISSKNNKIQPSYDKLIPFWKTKLDLVTITPSYLEKYIPYDP